MCFHSSLRILCWDLGLLFDYLPLLEYVSGLVLFLEKSLSRIEMFWSLVWIGNKKFINFVCVDNVWNQFQEHEAKDKEVFDPFEDLNRQWLSQLVFSLMSCSSCEDFKSCAAAKCLDFFFNGLIMDPFKIILSQNNCYPLVSLCWLFRLLWRQCSTLPCNLLMTLSRVRFWWFSSVIMKHPDVKIWFMCDRPHLKLASARDISSHIWPHLKNALTHSGSVSLCSKTASAV